MKRINKPNWSLLKLKIPQLGLKHKLILYISMIVLAALALINVATNYFSLITGIVIYILAACTLFAGMYYLVVDIKHKIKKLANTVVESNAYVSMVASDYRLRTVVFAVPGLISNTLFALFNGVVAIINLSAWLGSLTAYYLLLSMMRIGAVRQERLIAKIDDREERMRKEIDVYQKNSFLFILMALVLIGMIILLEMSQGGTEYPGFTIYAAAAYAFYKIIKSTIDVVKVVKRESPLLSTIKRIGYIDACVSILTLQTALFAAFANDQEILVKIMNGATGAGVCVVVLFLGIQGLYLSRKKRLALEAGGNDND